MPAQVEGDELRAADHHEVSMAHCCAMYLLMESVAEKSVYAAAMTTVSCNVQNAKGDRAQTWAGQVLQQWVLALAKSKEVKVANMFAGAHPEQMPQRALVRFTSVL
jgi:hypothetical protein